MAEGPRKDKNTLTAKEAIARLPAGKQVHTFRSTPLALIGADWDRAEILDLLKHAERIDITGPQAQAMGHGLAVDHQGSPLFIATKKGAA